jgi:RNA polymerase sigma factor (sigma-70 family)
MLVEPSDGVLLERVAKQRDEVSFATLVGRHGALVLDVCRRVLRQEQDAEDAFQATFLVLFRKAGSISKRESLGSWLYSVAYRNARKAQGKRARRQMRETGLSDDPAAEAPPPGLEPEVRALLDEEVNRLPDKYRLPFVFCYFEGKTNEQAAQQLGCALGTVQSRLSRARDRLRSRLTRRGLAFPAALVAAVLAERAASAEVPASLVETTVRAAPLFATGQTGAAGAASARVVALAAAVLRELFLRRLRKVALGLLALAALVVLSLFLLRPAPKPKSDQELLQGTWGAVGQVVIGGQGFPGDGVGGTFTADRVTLGGIGWSLQFTYRLDPTKNPKEIDLFPVAGANPWLGIYRLEGDQLQLIYSTTPGVRPNEFAGGPWLFYTFRRAGPEGGGP